MWPSQGRLHPASLQPLHEQSFPANHNPDFLEVYVIAAQSSAQTPLTAAATLVTSGGFWSPGVLGSGNIPNISGVCTLNFFITGHNKVRL